MHVDGIITPTQRVGSHRILSDTHGLVAHTDDLWKEVSTYI
jgi:hypothetical protein